MKGVVCTLFEGSYHFGAGALVNSLCRGGFTGTVYAGFRGPLPPWAEPRARAVGENRWDLTVSPQVQIVFLKQTTSAHFTNYKPDFLLQVEALEAHQSDAVVYCDPDIVLKGKWHFVEDWLTCGITLCEDVNSPVDRNHPLRVGWRRAFGPLGFDLKYRGSCLANGGFIGVPWVHRQFLLTWQTFIAHIAKELGGADVAGISGGRKLSGNYGFANCFRNTDQDAMNAALEALPDIPASFLGRQAMGFQAGNPLLPHALGAGKPWRRKYIREALGGTPPTRVDRAFWDNVEKPIQVFSSGIIANRRFQLTVGAALGRLIQRA